MSNEDLLKDFNAFQRTAVEAYPDAFDLLYQEGSPTGDTLFDFVMIELSTKEDCETLDDAISRMSMAIRDIEKVRDALVELLPDNPEASDPTH